MASASVQIQYRRTISWTFCVLLVLLAKLVGLKLPRRVVQWFARKPGQYRVGNGPWQTIRLDPTEMRRRLG
jgi:hypothetical protein